MSIQFLPVKIDVQKTFINGVEIREDYHKQLCNSCRDNTSTYQAQSMSLRKRMTQLLMQKYAFWRQRVKTHWYKKHKKKNHTSGTARKNVNHKITRITIIIQFYPFSFQPLIVYEIPSMMNQEMKTSINCKPYTYQRLKHQSKSII